MTIDSMRRIDKYLGIPLCWALSGWERFFRFFRRPPRNPHPERILFIELSEMGSMVLAYSLLVETRKAYPGARLFFLTFVKNRYAVDILDFIPPEDIIPIDDRSLPRFILSFLRVILRMRSLRPDTVLDLELFARATTVLSYLSGARRRVGFHRFHSEGLYRGRLITHRAAFNPHIHIAHNLLNLLHALRARSGEIPPGKVPIRPESLRIPRFTPTPEETARVKARLEAAGPGMGSARRIVLLNPNAGDLIPIRRWPEEYYIELARRILEKPDVYVVLTGTREEAAAAEKIAAGIDSPRCVSLAGQTTFRELITLYAIGDVLITNDSGPAHFSSLTDIHRFVFFGPETPALYGPLGEGSHALYAGFACSPCVSAFNHRKSPCLDNRCLRDITPDSVFERIRDRL